MYFIKETFDAVKFLLLKVLVYSEKQRNFSFVSLVSQSPTHLHTYVYRGREGSSRKKTQRQRTGLLSQSGNPQTNLQNYHIHDSVRFACLSACLPACLHQLVACSLFVAIYFRRRRRHHDDQTKRQLDG